MALSTAAVGARAVPWWGPALDALGESRMDPVAYDTAWVARVRAPGGRALAFPEAWSWLLANQRPDGSWGAAVPFAPDRLAATLAAVVALTEGARDHVRSPAPEAVGAGLRAIARLAGALATEPTGVETVGFEICVPGLLVEARSLGLAVPPDLEVLSRRREAKLARLPDGWRRAPPPSLAHSLEGWAGERPPAGLVDAAGSCANSPSATACLQRLSPSPAAWRYLRRVTGAGGGVPNVHPFEVFETAWVLDHLAQGGCPLRAPALAPHLERLRAARQGTGGWGISATGLEPDADDTALALAALARAGRPADPEALLPFERDAGFACFHFERDPSVSANIHVAYALLRMRAPGRVSLLAKVLGFLADARRPEGCWTDKWHLSPYYPTARAVIALHSVAADLVAPAVRWLRETQHGNGGWGVGDGSPEETAYAVEALTAAGACAPAAMRRARAFLRGRREHPALWIGKGLYCPRRVVDAAVSAARRLVERWGP